MNQKQFNLIFQNKIFIIMPIFPDTGIQNLRNGLNFSNDIFQNHTLDVLKVYSVHLIHIYLSI